MSGFPKSDRGSNLPHAREVLASGAKAIQQVSTLLNGDFDAAVSLLLELSVGGRLLLSGMGKAGFIAQKISATFASIGIPSFYLHPAEAIHGDLGRLTKKDVALILSNSGETPEIIRLLPHLRRIGTPVIAMTAKAESSLGQHSDLVLSLGKIDEAGHLGLAPTTSTTAMLALGDALAMCVLSHRGVTREEFALYHPGGNLGRSLMLVREVMRTGDEQCVVTEDISAKDAIHRYSTTKGRPGAATIVDKGGAVVGVFTDGNLRRCLDTDNDFLKKKISEVMTRNPKVITAEKLASEALRLLSEFKIDQLIVVDEHHKPIGMIDIQDLIDFQSVA